METRREATCKRVGVPVGLRQDRPMVLQQAGFDASAPSAWSAEGLMPYLPPTAQELLFDHVQGLAVAGSRIAVEALGPDFLDPEYRARRRERMDRVRGVDGRGGPKVPSTDELWYFEEREDVADWLRRHGWVVTVASGGELLARYGRTSPKEVEDAAPRNLFVFAQRAG